MDEIFTTGRTGAGGADGEVDCRDPASPKYVLVGKCKKKIKGHERPAEDISELKKKVRAELISQGEGYQAFRVNLKK